MAGPVRVRLDADGGRRAPWAVIAMVAMVAMIAVPIGNHGGRRRGEQRDDQESGWSSHIPPLDGGRIYRLVV
ncbi:MAG: hypothetical protein KIT31_01415 [Deltaproteobacteria bacterium]|nr:hypothetical protein [Deltaproteobacteria bacterium]